MQGLPKEPKKLEDNIAVWAEFKEISMKYNCISLGEGSPIYEPPKFLRDAMKEAIDEGHNQYVRTWGVPELVKAVARIYGKKLGREVDPLTEVIVHMGANGGLHSFIMALVNEGDEVVMFAPSFPMYFDHIRLTYGVVKTVPLEFHEGTWRFDPENLRKALSDKTKLFIFNNPNNPAGKCFTREEMETISSILDEFPHVVTLSDEVYEHLTFDDREHIHFATIRNNYERTVSIFSGGKLFNCTGWKIGWTIAPPQITRLGGIISNTVFYSTNAPGQVAFARVLDKATEPYADGMTYVQHLRHDFQQVRDLLIEGFKTLDLPVEPLPAEGGYFIMVDVSKCKDLVPDRFLKQHEFEDTPTITKNQIFMEDGRVPLDLAFCRWMAVERGVIMMPNILFQHKDSPYKTDNYVRVAISRGLELSKQALDRLKKKEKTD